MIKSIQSRLTIALTAAAVLLSAGTGAFLYRVVGSTMQRNFDRGLLSKGQAVVSLVSLEAGGILDFEFNQAAMPEYRATKKGDFFQIRFADGRSYARSASLGESDLWFDNESSTENAWYDLTLLSGHIGRAVRITFIPQSEQPPPTAPVPMVAVIARDREDLDENLMNLLGTLVGAAIVLAGTTAVVSTWIVHRSLRPLRRVADQAATIDVTHLNTRLGQQGLPHELQPICNRMNDLLAHLEAAFTREKRFTSDVAHELRTPVAELRSVAEVTLKYSDDKQELRNAVSESLAIAVQMERLINTLLGLVRAENDRAVEIPPQPIQLSSLIEKVSRIFARRFEERALIVDVSSEATVSCDPTLLKSVLTNLLANALDYSTGTAPIHCKATTWNNQWKLSIENEAANLNEDDLPHLFEPFWRKDTARHSTEHVGLGLSLVQIYCRLMNVEIAVSFPAGHHLNICLTFAGGCDK